MRPLLVGLATLLLSAQAIAQAVCVPDLDGDGHPLFGMTVERVDGETDSDEWGVAVATSVALADLDGDGDLDAALAMSGRGVDPNLKESYVGIALNRGDGVYDRGERYNAGLEVAAVELADMNRDGHLDIVVAAAGSDEVGVLLGRGDGTFEQAMLFPAGDEPRSLAVADFDGDGILDVATLNTLSGDISILAGNGDGTLAPQRRIDPGGAITPRGNQNRTFPWPGPFLAAGDIDGDGDIDLALPRVTHIGLLLNDGAGGFSSSPHRVPGPARYIYAVELHDIDGDGDLDALASVFGGSGGQSWLVVGLNAGDGTFATSHYDASVAGHGWNYWSATLAVGDVDEDGDDDVVLGSWAIPSALLLRNHGDGAFAPVERIEQTSRPWVVALGDANGDGANDLFTTHDRLRSHLTTSLNDRRGGFHVPLDIEEGLETGILVKHLQVSDFDGDGILDALVVAQTWEPPFDVWLLRGLPGIAFEVSDTRDFGLPEQSRITGSAIDDINGDGLDDFVLIGEIPWFLDEPDGIVWVALNPGDGTLGDFQRLDLHDGRADSPVVADINGDGHNDLAFYEGQSGVEQGQPAERRVVVYLNQGDGMLRFHDRIVFGADDALGFSNGALGVADLDRDGDLDLIVTSEVTRISGTLCLLENDGAANFTLASCREIGNSPRGLVVADFDGDGIDDAAVAHSFYQEDSPYLTVFLGDGRGGLIEDQAYFDPDLNYQGGDFRSADFNGDGAADLFFPTLDGDAIVVHLNDGRGGFASRALYGSVGGTPSQSLAAADFDGDGRIDIMANMGHAARPLRLLRNVACLCPADLDGDGAATPADFLLYLDLFTASSPRADFTGDGTIDVADFFAYLDAFAAGCD